MARRRIQFALAASFVAGALLAAPAGAAMPALEIIYDAGTVSITLPDGTPVGGTSAPGTVIPPGTYNLVFNIVSGSPSILIVGPGLSISFDEPEDFAITRTFAPDSSYTFQNETPASPVMVFSTSAAPPAAPGTTTTTPAGPTVSNTSPIGSEAGRRPVLDLVLTRADRLSFTSDGKPVERLVAGPYRIALEDRAGNGAVALGKRGAAPIALASRRFVGSRSLSVDLTPGRWRLSSGPKSAVSFTVT